MCGHFHKRSIVGETLREKRGNTRLPFPSRNGLAFMDINKGSHDFAHRKNKPRLITTIPWRHEKIEYSTYITNERELPMDSLKKQPNEKNYSRLLRIVLATMTIFNRSVRVIRTTYSLKTTWRVVRKWKRNVTIFDTSHYKVTSVVKYPFIFVALSTITF